MHNIHNLTGMNVKRLEKTLLFVQQQIELGEMSKPLMKRAMEYMRITKIAYEKELEYLYSTGGKMSKGDSE